MKEETKRKIFKAAWLVIVYPTYLALHYVADKLEESAERRDAERKRQQRLIDLRKVLDGDRED